MPAVGGPSSEPGERREPADDTRAYDGRLPADGEDVRGDRGDDRELARHTRQAQQPAEGVDPSREERNVLPGYGQEVIQAGGTEVVLNVRGQAFVLAEHDPEHDPAADSVRSARNGALDPLAKPVAEPGEPAATTELAPARRVEDDADPLAREPLPLVEAVVFGPWLDDSHRGLEDRASCRRRAADREHEQHALADRHVPEGPRGREHARRPGRRACRRDRHELRRSGLAEFADQHALAESIHAQRAPRDPQERDHDGEHRNPCQPAKPERDDQRHGHRGCRARERHRDPDR